MADGTVVAVSMTAVAVTATVEKVIVTVEKVIATTVTVMVTTVAVTATTVTVIVTTEKFVVTTEKVVLTVVAVTVTTVKVMVTTVAVTVTTVEIAVTCTEPARYGTIAAMNRNAVLFFSWLLISQPLLAQPPMLAKPKVPAEVAVKFLDQIAAGNYQAATVGFADAMKEVATPQQLAGVWADLQNRFGPYKKRVGTRTERQGAFDVVFATTEFEHGVLDLKVVIDEAGRVAGFFVTPPKAPEYAPPAYVKQDAFRESEVTVGSGEWALPGTLAMPVGAGPFPAVVLVHGSGPNDRDETVAAAKPFRDLAWGLASRGVAVLRYEKSTRQHGARLGSVPNFTVRQETVDDAVAAAALLRGTKGIDPGRVYVLGHSLGAMLVPRIGAQDPKIAGFIVMAGPARPLEDIILEQVTHVAGLDGSVSEQEKTQIEGLRQEVAKVKALQPPATGSATGSILSAPASYWLDLRGYNPPEAAKALARPLLILQGERDYQVTPDNFEAWKKALGDRKDVTFKSYPRLNHLFIEGEGKSGPAEYQKPGHVAEAVVVDVAGWIKARAQGNDPGI